MSDRLEREIEDIVEKAGNLPPPPRRSRRTPRPRSADGSRSAFARGIKIAALLVVVVLVGALLWGVTGSISGMLGLGVLFLLGAVVLNYFRNGSTTTLPGGYEKRWRGQALYSGEPQGPSFWERIRGRFSRRRT